MNGRVQSAMDKINQLNPNILTSNSRLLFTLQQQRLIQLIQQNNIDKAVAFAQRELAPAAATNSEFLNEMEKIMSLLAFVDHQKSPVAHILGSAHRQKIANEVNEAILKIQGQSKDTQLAHVVQRLIAEQEKVEKQLEIAFPKMTDIVSGTLHMTTPE